MPPGMSFFFPLLAGGAAFSRTRSSTAATFLGVAAAHVVLLVLLLAMTPQQLQDALLQPAQTPQPLTVRLIEAPAPVSEPPPIVPQPLPQPRLQPRSQHVPAITPRIMTVATAPAPVDSTSFSVPAMPAILTEAPPATVPPAPTFTPPATVAVTQPRFDAAYLNNPKPLYPAISRRFGEEGKVVLRVQVAADGSATDVEIRQTSGFARLDAAAREAVVRWRFVPAKQGDVPITAAVLVPIVFNLES